MWTVKFRNGSVKRFKFPIRTTPEEGSAVPDLWAVLLKAADDLNASVYLMSEPACPPVPTSTFPKM